MERNIESSPPLRDAEGLDVDLERSDSRGGEELSGEMRWIRMVREGFCRRRFGGLILQQRIHNAAENVSTVGHSDL